MEGRCFGRQFAFTQIMCCRVSGDDSAHLRVLGSALSMADSELGLDEFRTTQLILRIPTKLRYLLCACIAEPWLAWPLRADGLSVDTEG